MDKVFKIILGAIIAILIIGAAVMLFTQPSGTINDGNNSSINQTIENVTNLQQGDSANATSSNNVSNTNTANSSASSSSNAVQSSGDNSVVKGGSVHQNYQEGSGTYYQIDYADGNFRQYDTKTGELIGSSFEEDQAKLGVVNGDRV